MQPASSSDETLARIERHLLDIQLTLQHQMVAVARLQDELDAASRHADWYHIQFSEIIRTIARDLRDLRATLIYSVVNDGPISAQVIQALIQQNQAAEQPQDSLDPPHQDRGEDS